MATQHTEDLEKYRVFSYLYIIFSTNIPITKVLFVARRNRDNIISIENQTFVFSLLFHKTLV